MLTGKEYKLQKPTLALEVIGGKRYTVTIPDGAVLKVLSGPTGAGDRMVDVLFEGRTVVMFAIDVKDRGTEIMDRSANA